MRIEKSSKILLYHDRDVVMKMYSDEILLSYMRLQYMVRKRQVVSSQAPGET